MEQWNNGTRDKGQGTRDKEQGTRNKKQGMRNKTQKPVGTKRIIQKILLATVWIGIGSGLLVLLVAAIGKKNKQQCSDYVITIKGSQNNFPAGCCAFVDKNDVLNLIIAASGGKIKGQPMRSFNLMKLENLLKNHVWIQAAELYFDNQDILHISITERQPVARIFTTGGSSFYIDSSTIRMPLSETLSARVPVFTNFPDKKILTKKDSVLLTHIKQAAQFIMNDPFWMAQVSQIDITSQRTFEMIPTIGNHLVKLGSIENLKLKFQRLFTFYNQVLTKTGFDKYSVIDVQFAGQVIGTKKGTTTAGVDSVQLRYNVLKLLQQSRQIQEEATSDINTSSQKLIIGTDSVIEATNSPDTAKPVRPAKEILYPNPWKSKILSNSKKKATGKPKPGERRTPKAVMPALEE